MPVIFGSCQPRPPHILIVDCTRRRVTIVCIRYRAGLVLIRMTKGLPFEFRTFLIRSSIVSKNNTTHGPIREYGVFHALVAICAKNSHRPGVYFGRRSNYQFVRDRRGRHSQILKSACVETVKLPIRLLLFQLVYQTIRDVFIETTFTDFR